MRHITIKKTVAIIILALTSLITNGQTGVRCTIELDIVNSITQKPISESEGVVANIKYSYFAVNIVSAYGPSILNLRNKDQYNYEVQAGENDYQTPVSSYRTVFSYSNIVGYIVTISGPGYETQVLSGNMCTPIGVYQISQNALGQYDADGMVRDRIKNQLCPENKTEFLKEIYLIPKRTVIDGNLNVTTYSSNQATQSSNQTTNELGLLTTKTIAEGLGISEEDVIKLITSNQLKGKKIGEKYFVRKEDFDAYMKK